MFFKSKKTSLLLLGIISIVSSRVLFFFFNDPEGPNLLVVIGTAVFLYLLSLGAYVLNFSVLKKFVLAISIQILLAVGLYFFLT